MRPYCLEFLPQHGDPEAAAEGQSASACGAGTPVDDEEHGTVLDGPELRKLVNGFKGSVMFPIVAVTAFTGTRRNEILALRWADLDGAGKKLRIERIDQEGEDAAARHFPVPALRRQAITSGRQAITSEVLICIKSRFEAAR
jgi:integrase